MDPFPVGFVSPTLQINHVGQSVASTNQETLYAFGQVLTLCDEARSAAALDAEAEVIWVHCVVAHSGLILGACTGTTGYKSRCDELFEMSSFSLKMELLERMNRNDSSRVRC